MTLATLVPLIGSIVDGDVSDANKAGLITIVTSSGFVVAISAQDIEIHHVIQAGREPAESLYRLFVVADAQLSVKLKARDFANLDESTDGDRASLLRSGASKRIEDTA